MSPNPAPVPCQDVVLAEGEFLFIPTGAELTPCQWAHVEERWFDTGTSEERGRIWRQKDDNDD